MESKERYIEFISGAQYTKLKWEVAKTSDEMIIDAIDSLGKLFLTYFNSTFLNFLVIPNQNDHGKIVSIDAIVDQKLSPIYVRGPDGNRNQIELTSCNQPRRHSVVGENFSTRKFYVIKNCSLVEELQEKEYNMEEVAVHNKKSDCWTVIDGKVYDITKYIKSHPGGSVILRVAGKDGTALFNKTHPWVGEHLFRQFRIGLLSKISNSK